MIVVNRLLVVFLFLFLVNILFAYEKLDLPSDECYLIEYDTKEIIHKMPDKWYKIIKNVVEKDLKDARKNNNNGQIDNLELFLKRLETDHIGATDCKKSLFVGNNDFGLWCEDFRDFNTDISYFCDGSSFIRGSLGNIIFYNLKKHEGWGTDVTITNEKDWYLNFPLLGFNTNYYNIVENKSLYDNVYLNVENNSISLMDSENVYIKYVFGSNEIIPKKVVIDYYCDYDFTYHQRTLELTLSKIEKYKVSNILKDVYHPKNNTMVRDLNKNKMVFYTPNEKSIIEVLIEKQNKKISKEKAIVFIIRFIVFILILYVFYRLLNKLFIRNKQ